MLGEKQPRLAGILGLGNATFRLTVSLCQHSCLYYFFMWGGGGTVGPQRNTLAASQGGCTSTDRATALAGR